MILTTTECKGLTPEQVKAQLHGSVRVDVYQLDVAPPGVVTLMLGLDGKVDYALAGLTFTKQGYTECSVR